MKKRILNYIKYGIMWTALWITINTIAYLILPQYNLITLMVAIIISLICLPLSIVWCVFEDYRKENSNG